MVVKIVPKVEKRSDPANFGKKGTAYIFKGTPPKLPRNCYRKGANPKPDEIGIIGGIRPRPIQGTTQVGSGLGVVQPMFVIRGYDCRTQEKGDSLYI